jgi:hypothetical protein
MADAYKLKQDASLPRVLRYVKAADGSDIEETTGQAYAKGDYVLASAMTDRDRERAENGDLDHILEESTVEEAQQAWAEAGAAGVFIPEHEVERYALLDAGHVVVERDQVLELRAAGAEAFAEAFEASGAAGDPSPGVTEQASFQEVSSINSPDPVLPTETPEPLSAEVVEKSGVEQPPGIPVGPTLAKAEGASESRLDKLSRRTRQKPGSRDRE